MKTSSTPVAIRGLRLLSVMLLALFFVSLAILFAKLSHTFVYAAPIEPPEGYPKLSMSRMTVNPELAQVGGQTLEYVIEIVNTGAYMANGVSLSDLIPANTTYNGDATASVPPAPTFANGALTWTGNVGFDSSVQVRFSVTVAPTYAGKIVNTATLHHPLIAEPVTLRAETIVSNQPVFTLQKTASPELPGPGKPLTYRLEVTNVGQPAAGLPVTVSDPVPSNTTVSSVGSGGTVSPNGRLVTWQRSLNLDTGDTSVFTFTVNVGNVPSGTVLTNQNYQVSSASTSVTVGDVHTTTVVNPQLFISKTTFPDPPGANREMTYTLSVLNKGSLATNLVVTDQVPSGVTYLRGGSYQNGRVSWTLSSLGTGESAQFSYTVDVPDVADVTLLNQTYRVCSAEGICKDGKPLSSLVQGPNFSASAWVDPIAKKPGGGNSPVTPTLVLRNEGPGTAVDATALMYFQRISVQFSDLVQDPANGQFFPGPECGDKCVAYRWVGDLAAGETITFTTSEGQNSIGGEQGNHYTATLVITDVLGAYVTEPYTATASGMVTHYANLIPEKSAPPVIGAGQVMTYVVDVFNSGLSTDTPPYPVLTETVPASVTLLSASDGGLVSAVDGNTLVSWQLPSISTGSHVYRSFTVQVDSDLVSGTQIVNQDYYVTWHETEVSEPLTNPGEPVTTTVREVGLIDSFKTVTPTLVRPGEGQVLTFTLHIVNSSPLALTGVQVDDVFPWENSTYRRDAVASAGVIVSDIVSLAWHGDVAPYATELITLSVLVDTDYEGPITNTATIQHASLREPVEITAVAYVTDDPVLKISKTASPDPVRVGDQLLYTIRVENLGQQATNLVLTDTVPANTAYVPGSATAGGVLTGDQVRWEFPVLVPGEVRTFSFRVTPLSGSQVINADYAVSCAEGVSARGEPLVTGILRYLLYLPVIFR